ncbi:hypothetical protein PHYBLDRAFT_147489 [Phycomyces blakesleeanus NRRL 1555(-)]|uniref:Uncharacterized protein n=1 Tax=Phycomyces blakesleeanus (strain ATCC 8743b / DSM 1359 / FGSC 10004 / NBRC 33097 / NRRL 1555) TaxID=763407 RepID=A0A162TX90_PHYB8|nr:hypothetical protein PHYBLDRAFT_147489 [Phycomyces blakesleeanus NRRL 1555(-)]OAD71732.1 hypothetical protein PHYBLDRAFT_147489 [Phycomyces blakesleeanus NRRL 1555(-)]|eukprot:XP_018289772.1 hypothetical protein PHYBLDRAFT_147489 [Phycomyces blakesleeanus NRRL 1555(-)]
MSSKHLNCESLVLSAQTDLSRMDASANTQADTSLETIGRICNVLATCSTALADAIEQNLSEERKNQIRQTITTIEGDLTILISAHGHLLHSSLSPAEQETHQSCVVPREMPIFQWQGNEWDTTQKVYSSIEECFEKLEDVLHSSPELHWSFARDAFICVYGINDLERQVQLTHELMLMRMRATESAKVADNMQAAIAYTATLLPELACQVSLLQVNMPREKWDTIEKAASLARSIYNTVPHTPTRPSSACSSSFFREITQSCERSSSKKCSLHGKGNHDTEDCCILKTALATKGGNWVEKTPHINKYVGSTPCCWCGEVWSCKHCCTSVSGSSSFLGSVSGSSQRSAPHFAVHSVYAVTNNSTFLEASSSEDDQSMVMNFEQCSPYTGATISSVNIKLCSKFEWLIIPCKRKIVLATFLDLAGNIDVSIATYLMLSLSIHLLGLAESWYSSTMANRGGFLHL